MIYTHDRVRVTATWSSFVGMAGRVTATRPHIMVILDGDRLPIRVTEREIARLDTSEISMTGAE